LSRRLYRRYTYTIVANNYLAPADRGDRDCFIAEAAMSARLPLY